MVSRMLVLAALVGGMGLLGAVSGAEPEGAPDAKALVGSWKTAPKAKEQFELTITADRVSYNFSDKRRAAQGTRVPYQLQTEGGKTFLELKKSQFDKPTDLSRLYVTIKGETLSVTIPKEADLAGAYQLQRAKAP